MRGKNIMGLTLAASLGLSGALATPAAAEDDELVSSAEVVSASVVESDRGLNQGTIAKFDRYVQQDDSGKFVLRIPKDSDFDPSELAAVKRAINVSNEQIDAAHSIPTNSVTVEDDMATIQATHGGFKVHWWGTQVWLDNYAVGKLNKMLAAGAGVAGLTAAIMSATGVGGATAGVIAAAFTASAGVANLCNWSDKGITINRTHTGQVWCWPR